MFEKLKFWKKEGEIPGTDLKEFSKPFELGGLPAFDDDGTAGFAGTPHLGKSAATVDVPSKYTQDQMAGAGGLTPVGPRMHQEQQYYPQQQAQQMPHPDIAAKDFEIVSAKLDAIRTSIDFLGQRLDNIDQMLRQKRGGW